MTSWAEQKLGPLCAECTLREQPGPVPGEGSRERAILIYIAQNPGMHEVRERPMRPLVGPSGNVFNRQLFESGVKRDELYITNQVKCLTPANRAPTDLEIRCCKPILAKELETCKADTVLLSGAVAFKANIGSYSTISKSYRPTDNIMNRMGCVEQRDGRKWIGTIHPAFIMRMPEWKEAALDHLRKAFAIAGVEVPLPRVISHPTDDEIEQHKQAARDRCAFADDVETHQMVGVEEDDYVGGDYQVDMCGFSAIPYEAIILNPNQIHLWQDIFEDPSIEQFEHNGEYDRYHLEKVCAQLNRRFDTMHAFHYLRSYFKRKGLKPTVVSLFTNLPYYDRTLEKVDRRLYCGMDNIATLLAGIEQKRQLEKWRLEEVFASIGMRIPEITEEWRRIGVNIDLRRALLYRKFMEERIAKGELLVAKIAGPLFNPNSPQQVAKLLYEDWQLPKQYNEVREGNTYTRKLTTDNEARKRLRKWIQSNYDDRYKIPKIFLDLQDYLEGEKTKLTFLDRISPDGRIHAYFKPHGTSSFRLSSTPNLQNWPVYDVSQWGGARRDVVAEGTEVPTGEKISEEGMGSLRSIVIPDDPENDWILTIDFEQIELWAYAVQSKCKWLLSVYERGEYIYGTVYEQFYRLPFFQEGKPRKKKFKLDSVSEKFLRRAKAIPLGYLYGRSARAVAEEHGWTEAEAAGYRTQWFKLCPELLEQYARDRFQMEQKGYIRYPFGHVIHYPNRKLSDVYAMRGQNPAAGMLLTSLIKVTDEFKRRKYQNTRIMLSVHDSLSFNIPGRHVEEVYEEVIAPIILRQVPELDGFVFRHSAEIGKRWDWDVEDYPTWKANRANADSRRAGGDRSQAHTGQEDRSKQSGV